VKPLQSVPVASSLSCWIIDLVIVLLLDVIILYTACPWASSALFAKWLFLLSSHPPFACAQLQTPDGQLSIFVSINFMCLFNSSNKGHLNIKSFTFCIVSLAAAFRHYQPFYSPGFLPSVVF